MFHRRRPAATPRRTLHSRPRMPFTSWGLVALLMSSGTMATAAMLATPHAAYAYTARVNLFIYRDPGEDYENFLRRAEMISRAGVQRALDADLLATEVIVTVVGENQGISVPIMTVQVTRNEWRETPDPQYWTTYYDTASFLLGL
jgi:hypothetical protein